MISPLAWRRIVKRVYSPGVPLANAEAMLRTLGELVPAN